MEEERSLNKERLEASLTWLCELEILKQRQESLVLGALSLGDSVAGCPARGDVGPARSSREQEQLTLRRHLLMLALQQQLSQLRLDTGLACEQNNEEDLDSPSASSSGTPQPYESFIPHNVLQNCWTILISDTYFFVFLAENIIDKMTKMTNNKYIDAYMLDWQGHTEPTVHTTLPHSFSSPYPPLEGIWIDDGPTEEDIQQAMRVEMYILGLLQRRHFRSTAELNSDPDQWHDLHTYPPSYPELDQSQWQEWTTLSDEENKHESQDGYYMNLPNSKVGPTSLSSDEPESSLEMDQYGIEEVYTSSNVSPRHQPVYIEHRPTMSDTMKPHIHTCCNHTCVPTLSTAESHEQHQPIPSQKWALLQSLARMSPDERWTTLGERQTKSTIRSQSEDSCASQGWTTQPEHKYYTVGRDMGRHHSDELYPSNQRLWCSSADLSQEEDEGIFREDVHKSIRLNQSPAKCISVQFLEQDLRVQEWSEATTAPPNGSDSSLRQNFSPGTSSVSSDSDESAGLVWPQQLPPRLPPSSSSPQNPSNAMVKIKASHVLKKKIMRFRSGSLKLMTTV
uniref:Uncharacterized protein n=1 Tax=Cyprinus carpio TaxID=7962 RepID=A0A8C1MW08_CYPCA